MIRRVYLKNLLSFRKTELEFAPGLVVLTGPSGAGKSLLMQAILADLGIGSSEAELSEIEISRPSDLVCDAYEAEETIALKAVRKERVSYYFDGQKISRRYLRELFSPYVQYLSVRDRGGFESETLAGLLDTSRSSADASYAKLLGEYRERYGIYADRRAALEEILRLEKERSEKMEFARFEIDRISAVDPKEGEYEELLKIKQRLSRIDKIKEAMEKAAAIFDFEESVQELFALSEKEGAYFGDAMNQLRADMEEASDMAEELEELDIENILDRLEKLSDLIRRYGSIPEALEYKAEKERELENYENAEKDQDALKQFLQSEEKELLALASRISQIRREEAAAVEKRLANYLTQLRLPEVSFTFTADVPGPSGADRIDLEMEGSDTSTLSGGEFNRLRLALMTVTLEGAGRGEGAVFLDEIDANVSGDESIAIAEMIARLAKVRQVFAISHQPHLSVRADQHILVRKIAGESIAESLGEEARIREVARIVGGEKADDEAVAFARKLRGSPN